MTVYLGIDWSKSKHDICWMNEQGGVLNQKMIKHGVDGFGDLEHSRAKLGMSVEDCVVGIETAHNLLIDFLWSCGYRQVYVVPPSVTKASRGRVTSSGAHDDRFDAKLLADILRTGRSGLTLWQPDGNLVRQMRAKVSLLLFLRQDITRQTNRLREVLARYYPAALEVFSDLNTQIALNFIQAYPAPKAAAALSLEEFKAFARRHRYTYPSRLDQRFLQLQHPQPPADPVVVLAYESEAKLLARSTLDRIHTRLSELAQLNELFDMHPDAPLFQSLPGAGQWLAPALLAKFGDHRERFPSPAGLQALAGTCPVTSSSGKRRSIHFRKACDHEFRTITQQWAINSIAHSDWANTYFTSVRPTAHSNSHAYRCLANRWLSIAWSVWQSRKPYDETYHQQQRLARTKPRA